MFRALLRGPLAADASSVPVPETIKPAILRRLLHFIYTDALEPLSAEEAQHLLAAADHYDLKRLVALCAEALASKLSVDNAAYTLTLAAQHGAEGLKERALRFVVDNVAGVVASPGWAQGFPPGAVGGGAAHVCGCIFRRQVKSVLDRNKGKRDRNLASEP